MGGIMLGEKALITIRALGEWQVLLSENGLKETLQPDDVHRALSYFTPARVRIFQLALNGAGHCTEDFLPDGDAGRETLNSLWLLYKAAGLLDTSSLCEVGDTTGGVAK